MVTLQLVQLVHANDKRDLYVIEDTGAKKEEGDFCIRVFPAPSIFSIPSLFLPFFEKQLIIALVLHLTDNWFD